MTKMPSNSYKKVILIYKIAKEIKIRFFLNALLYQEDINDINSGNMELADMISLFSFYS